MRVSASDIRTDPRRATVLPAAEPGQDRDRAKTGQLCETAGRADYRTDVLMKDFVSGTAVRSPSSCTASPRRARLRCRKAAPTTGDVPASADHDSSPRWQPRAKRRSAVVMWGALQ